MVVLVGGNLCRTCLATNLIETVTEVAERRSSRARGRPEVTAAIVGARRTSQIEETIRAVDCIISESKQDLDLIEMLLD
ncbi:MAG: hypothetical protein ACE1Z0_01070, partial [Acidimicrobiia bacterium]